jgi:O-antigen/teichoic acid export membrane protein
MAGVFLIMLGPAFIGWWISPDFKQPSGQVLMILMISCFVFLPVRGVALPVVMGLGKPRIPTIAFLASGVLNLVLSLLLARPYGLAGVAIGTAIPNVLFAAVVLVVACRELGISLARYVSYVVPRAAIGAVPLVALLVWCRFVLDVQTIAGLATAGSATLVVFALTWIFFVYRNDPFVDLQPRLVRLRAWNRA